jgi:hypothetical protein
MGFSSGGLRWKFVELWCFGSMVQIERVQVFKPARTQSGKTSSSIPTQHQAPQRMLCSDALSWFVHQTL